MKFDKKKLLPVLIIFCLAVFPLANSLFTGQAPVNFDMFQADSQKPWDILQADGALQFYPWRDYVFNQWQIGKIAFWNPYQLAGVPILANSQSAPLYPFHIFFGISGIPTGTAMSLLAIIHLFIAGLGVRALTLRLGGSELGSLIAGGSFALCPFLLAWISLPSVLTTSAWIPWVLVGMHYLKGNPCVRQLWRLGLPVGLMFLGGHLQFAFYGLLAGIVFWIGSLVILGKAKEISWKHFVSPAIALAFGIALSAPQLLPTLEYSKMSHRKVTPSAEGLAAYNGSAIKPYELVGIVAPGLVGLPGQQDIEGERNPAYWPQFVKPGANFAESALYLGPVILLGLFLLKRKKLSSESWLLVIIGILAFLMAMGTAVNGILYYFVPGFSSTGSPGRASVLFVMCACGLAGLGWSSLEKNKETEPNKVIKHLPLILLGVISLGTLLMIQSMGSLQTWTGIDLAPIIARRFINTIPYLLGSLACAWLGWYLIQREDKKHIAGLALFGSFMFVILGFIPPTSKVPDFQNLAEKDHARYAHTVDDWTFLTPPKSELQPNFSTLAQIEDIAGYDSLLNVESVAMMREINSGEDPAPPVNGNMMLVKSGYDVEALLEAGVNSIIFPDGTTQQIGGQIFPDGIKLTEQSSQGFAIETSISGSAVIKYRNIPGWSATTEDGELLPLSGERWLEFDIPQGTSKITFKYIPPGYKNGLILFLGSILIFTVFPLLNFVSLGKTKPQNENKPQ